MLAVLIPVWIFICSVTAFVHPITVHGKYFVDTVTKEPFYIRGVDYQPGGSSAVSENSDPLSDPVTCARDILLFQDLNINTIRIYSINTDLNHDFCMSLLASAGIYLVLDVNSPLPNHHLNRYEPWTSYNEAYLQNVFKVIEQFSYYNNTLGFFAGNEVVNDERSAKHSPVYVKALVRDIKTYMEYNSPRMIPVGYSAADDLKYRMSFSDYLECFETNPAEVVDFYGVNSYQWCGEQTFYTSGYNILVDDYSDYNSPVFFSEFGCNEVTPRAFDEVQALYSNDMIDVFSGGLVYEFSQEPNNYGLVDIQPNGDIQLLPDYFALKNQFQELPEIDYSHVLQSMRRNAKQIQGKMKSQRNIAPECESSYANIDISKGVPESIAYNLIEMGVEVERGQFIAVNNEDVEITAEIFGTGGRPYAIDRVIQREVDIMSGSSLKGKARGYNNSTYDDFDCIYDSSDFMSDVDYSDIDEISQPNKIYTFFQGISNYLTKLFGKHNVT